MSIRQNFANFIEEGVAFYALGSTAQEGDSIFRLRSNSLGTYIYVTETERDTILGNASNGFDYVDEGIAFKALV